MGRLAGRRLRTDRLACRGGSHRPAIEDRYTQTTPYRKRLFSSRKIAHRGSERRRMSRYMPVHSHVAAARRAYRPRCEPTARSVRSVASPADCSANRWLVSCGGSPRTSSDPRSSASREARGVKLRVLRSSRGGGLDAPKHYDSRGKLRIVALLLRFTRGL